MNLCAPDGNGRVDDRSRLLGLVDLTCCNKDHVQPWRERRTTAERSHCFPNGKQHDDGRGIAYDARWD